jgi:hypothetical protein
VLEGVPVALGSPAGGPMHRQTLCPELPVRGTVGVTTRWP